MKKVWIGIAIGLVIIGVGMILFFMNHSSSKKVNSIDNTKNQ